jgi:hypothetical protein
MTDIEKAMLADPAVRAEFDALAPEYAIARAVIKRHATISTTLKRIRKHSPCETSWRKLLAGLGKTKADDEPLPYARIVEICGLDDALWATRAAPDYEREWRLYAVACARRVVHLNPDPRVAAALDLAERYAHGQATDEELAAAREAALEAVQNAEDAASEAARAAFGAAAEAAWVAAAEAAWVASAEAERAAGWAAASKAAEEAARAAEREWQRQTFVTLVGVPSEEDA